MPTSTSPRGCSRSTPSCGSPAAGSTATSLFHEVEVYDAEQDREKGFFRQLWERIAEGLAEILENPPREDVATVADISGPVSSPDASNLQVVLNLIENAFFDSILPGFREQAKGGD
jgi:hypothetical protein